MLWKQNNILREQYDMLWEQNNVLREQDNMLWEQNNILGEQDNMLWEQNNILRGTDRYRRLSISSVRREVDCRTGFGASGDDSKFCQVKHALLLHNKLTMRLDNF
jgi:phosphomevalonate kinase